MRRRAHPFTAAGPAGGASEVATRFGEQVPAVEPATALFAALPPQAVIEAMDRRSRPHDWRPPLEDLTRRYT
ncbi:hypothetical protein ACFTTN_04910 [Streptomyces niveus]|uniref:hypothetical protein n=1 Tax=Streptomyces niveus TaxID=193462 RepID=UPI00363250E2